jgi:hypothetical protein
MGLLLTAVLATTLGAPQSAPVAHCSFKHGKHGYHMVQVDFSSGEVAASVVSSPRLTSVWNMVRESQPIAAITGTFFDLRSQLPVADVLVDGDLRSQGSRGTVVAVDWFGAVRIFDRPYRSHVDWSEFRYGLRGAVRVVSAGKVNPNPKAQRFHDRRIWGRAARTGLGLTKRGKLLLFVTQAQVTLSEFGRAMKSRGVVDGVSLDGGGSTCMYYRGGLVVPPKRRLNNLFVISKRAPDRIAKTNDVEPVAGASEFGFPIGSMHRSPVSKMPLELPGS